MTNVQKFIKLANSGDWENFTDRHRMEKEYGTLALLDPLAWAAVGKVKGWPAYMDVPAIEELAGDPDDTDFFWDSIAGWKAKRRYFFELTEDKSIEEALGEILS